MKWLIKHGNIIDEPVDALICSANVMLNLSGGVGADLLGRFAEGIRPLLNAEFSPIEEVVMCLLQDSRVSKFAESLPEAQVVS